MLFRSELSRMAFIRLGRPFPCNDLNILCTFLKMYRSLQCVFSYYSLGLFNVGLTRSDYTPAGALQAKELCELNERMHSFNVPSIMIRSSLFRISSSWLKPWYILLQQFAVKHISVSC